MQKKKIEKQEYLPSEVDEPDDLPFPNQNIDAQNKDAKFKLINETWNPEDDDWDDDYDEGGDDDNEE